MLEGLTETLAGDSILKGHSMLECTLSSNIQTVIYTADYAHGPQHVCCTVCTLLVCCTFLLYCTVQLLFCQFKRNRKLDITFRTR